MAWNGSGGATVSPAKSKSDGRRPVKQGKPGSGRRLPVGTIVAVAAVGVAVWLGIRSASVVDDGGVESKVTKRLKAGKTVKKGAKESVRDAMPSKLPRRSRNGSRPVMDVDMFSHLSGEDRRMARAVQDALDKDDFEKTVAAATDALTSTNSEVRLNAVEALGWFGAQALPEITGAMLDADDDVRQAAGNRFELALDEFEKPGEKFKIAMAAFGSLKDENQLSSLGGIINSAATELIDGEEDEEKKLEKRVSVVQALVDIIEGGDSIENAEAAATAFNDITGNEWRGIDEAEKYLRDPENYEPPDPSAEQEPTVEAAQSAEKASPATDAAEQSESEGETKKSPKDEIDSGEESPEQDRDARA